MEGDQKDLQRAGNVLPPESLDSEVVTERAESGSPASDTISPPGQMLLPEATQQMLQELLELPGQLLPPETVHHLKNAGRETLLAFYSLWQNVNRATKGAPEEKVRKHIEVE
ncbi:MAG: hypothetical protein ABI670_22515 [Chloroflexota bacterium]